MPIGSYFAVDAATRLLESDSTSPYTFSNTHHITENFFFPSLVNPVYTVTITALRSNSN